MNKVGVGLTALETVPLYRRHAVVQSTAFIREIRISGSTWTQESWPSFGVYFNGIEF